MIDFDSLFKSYIQIMDKDKVETANCILVANVLNYILLDQGIENYICIGYAAWSVGQGNNDIITHLPSSRPINDVSGIDVHAWIEIGAERIILDFTTYQLKKKGKLLEEADGLKTNVKWCPSYLITSQDKVKSLSEIKKSKFAGKYKYEKDNKLKEELWKKRDEYSINLIIKTANEILDLNNNEFIR